MHEGQSFTRYHSLTRTLAHLYPRDLDFQEIWSLWKIVLTNNVFFKSRVFGL